MGKYPALLALVQSRGFTAAEKSTISLSPAKTCDAPMATATVLGSFGSDTDRSTASQAMLVLITWPFWSVNVLGSTTAFPMVVGNVGAEVPDSMIGIASQVIIDVPTASHVTVPSITSLPKKVGHVGSVPAELPAVGCTASNKKFVMGAAVSRFQLTKSAKPAFRLLVPLPAPIDTRTCAAEGGAVAVIDTFR